MDLNEVEGIEELVKMATIPELSEISVSDPIGSGAAIIMNSVRIGIDNLKNTPLDYETWNAIIPKVIKQIEEEMKEVVDKKRQLSGK